MAVAMDYHGCVRHDTLFLGELTYPTDNIVLLPPTLAYPNPVNDRLTITLKDPTTETYVLRITDTAGRMVHDELIPRDQRIWIVSTAIFPAGYYVLELEAASGVERVAIVVQH